MKVFLSYGHDANAPLVERIRNDLAAAGHEVWIDTAEIKAGDDWRRSILEGITGSDWTLGFLSRHSIRDPGVCLDELAIALHAKGGTIATVLVEAEAEVRPPNSVSHIQWLDMRDWADRHAEGKAAFDAWYGSKLAELLKLLNSETAQRFAGEIAGLADRLQPAAQQSDIGVLVDGFTGRDWLKRQIEDWRRNEPDSRLFWISGAPGTGKSAFAAWLAHYSRMNVIGINLCRYNVEDRRDPLRVLATLAFQMATRLPDYRRLLLDKFVTEDPEGKRFATRNVFDLFDWLLAEPLRLAIAGGRDKDRYVIVIDALDETIRDGRSSLAEALAASAHKLPPWLGMVVTSRPEPAILRQLAGFKPHVISAESADNIGDLRTYAARWLIDESLGHGDLEARVSRLLEAADGNFLYLARLRDAANQGLVDLDNPAGLPRGLVGLYEQWFRRQFGEVSNYERFVPLIEVLVAAEQPMPEAWLDRIFGWTLRERVRFVEGLGTLFERSAKGITPFHKSLRDWLTDAHAAGADFLVDETIGHRRIVEALWPELATWIETGGTEHPDGFVISELTAQLGATRTLYPRLLELARLLARRDIIERRVHAGTGVSEDGRRTSRHLLREVVAQLAQHWPADLDASLLWDIVRTVSEIARAGIDPVPNAYMLSRWDDIGMPDSQREIFAPHIAFYEEWNERVLLLVTAIDMAVSILRHRPELAPRVAEIADGRLWQFVHKDAPAFGDAVFRGAREYIPDRNHSFLTSSLRLLVDGVKSDPSLADWVRRWQE